MRIGVVPYTPELQKARKLHQNQDLVAAPREVVGGSGGVGRVPESGYRQRRFLIGSSVSGVGDCVLFGEVELGGAGMLGVYGAVRVGSGLL